MKIFVDCPHCGVIVGEVFIETSLCSQNPTDAIVGDIQNSILDCSNHHTATTKTKHLFDLIEQTLIVYHETNTSSLSFDYLGDSSKFNLWFALLFCGQDGIAVNGKLVWWDFKRGFTGSGLEELVNLHPKSA